MKAWTIAVKDTLVRFRDRNALLFMLAAPLILSAIMGAAFGNAGGGSSPIFNIPIILVNSDQGDLGEDFATILAEIEVDTAQGRQFLFAIENMQSAQEARRRVESGEVRGAILIPADFSGAVLSGDNSEQVLVQVLTDPAANVSPGILRGVVSRLANGFSVASIGLQTVPDQISSYSDLIGPRMAEFGPVLQEEFEAAFEETGPAAPIQMETVSVGEVEEPFNLMAYFAPSMAIFFLLFTLFEGTRSILQEEQEGTLQRLMTTPTSVAQILLGKIGGTFLTGVLQVTVLIVASALIFQLDWGDSLLGLVMMVVATVAAATSLGAFVAAFARNSSQANIVGTAITLIFAILGGNFIQTSGFPDWLNSLSKLTINRWALDGFTSLTIQRLGWNDVLLHFGVLMAIAALFFSLSQLSFRRRFVG